MALLLEEQTQQQFIQRFRERFRDSDKEWLALMSRFLLNKILAGDLTDTQCRNVFNLTVTQWNTLKTKMQNWATGYESVQNAVGE